MAAAKPIPDGFNTVSVYLIVPDSVEALEFYGKAFGAQTVSRMAAPGGRGTLHAEMRLGNSTVMLTDENPQWNARSPLTLGGSPVSIHIYVEDADTLYRQAVEAGCTETFPMNDTFWGDRYGKLKDPYGHEWSIATHKEDLTPEEIERGIAEWFASAGKGDS